MKQGMGFGRLGEQFKLQIIGAWKARIEYPCIRSNTKKSHIQRVECIFTYSRSQNKDTQPSKAPRVPRYAQTCILRLMQTPLLVIPSVLFLPRLVVVIKCQLGHL